MRTTTFITSLLFLTLIAGAQTRTVTIDAGKTDRLNAVVTFPFPANLDAKGPWHLAGQGKHLRIQMLPGNIAAFVLPELKAGESRDYKLEPAPMIKRGPLPTDIAAFKEGTSVNLQVGDKKAIRYNGEKTPLPAGFDPAFQRGGYLFPILTPSGKLIADDYTPKHKHHHGIWSPWTKTVFEGRKPDFWNMGAKTGTVEFVDLGETFMGEIAGGFSARHRMVDLTAKPQPKAAINETWNVTIFGVGTGDKPYFLFDLTTTQTCASDSPLILPKYHYGGLGFRGHRDWDGKDSCQFITSEGKTRANGNETRANWCWVGGKVDGGISGITIFGHPSNFRAPQPMRLHPDEPFFCFAPSQMGDWKIEPGTPYVAKFRFIVADGELDKALIERLYADYADPPTVTVK